MEIVITILAAATLVVAILTFLALTTGFFKRIIPLEFGFLLNDKIVNKLEISTGDPAKLIFLRFRNTKKTSLLGVVLDIRFFGHLGLSGTEQSLEIIPEKTIHGRVPDKSYYLIRHSGLEIIGHGKMDFRVELNTKGENPGTYKVGITVYSTQQDYKYKKSELDITIR